MVAEREVDASLGLTEASPDGSEGVQADKARQSPAVTIGNKLD